MNDQLMFTGLKMSLDESNKINARLIVWSKRVFALGIFYGIVGLAMLIMIMMKFEILRLAINRMLSSN